MYLGENNGNLSKTKNVSYSQPFLKMRKFLLDMRKDFLIMSNFYLVEILSQPNSPTIVTSKKLRMSNYVLILSIFVLIMRIRNLWCEVLPLVKQLVTNPLSKHFFSCNLTLSCKLLKFFHQNHWTKSGPGDLQFGIVPVIFFKLPVVISIFSCFLTLTSLRKSCNHFSSL